MKYHKNKYSAVVTGLGCITPIGNTPAELVRSVKNSQLPEVSSFVYAKKEKVNVLRVREEERCAKWRRLDPCIRYALYAFDQAIKDAQLKEEHLNSFRTGLMVSSSKGGMTTFEKYVYQKKHMAPMLAALCFANISPDMATRWIARRYHMRGPTKCLVSACASGAHSIIEAARMIEDGEVDMCIAGGTDASITPLMLAGYKKMNVYAEDKIRPFDKNRKGFIIGEGAGVLVIESKESAKKRGAKIYATIESYACGQDTIHPLHFSFEDAALMHTIEQAWARCNMKKIDYINAHATGTVLGDHYETEQIKRTFKKKASKIPVSATKSMTGHMLGASGAVEMIITIIALCNNIVPPTMNYQTVDSLCDLDYVPNKSRLHTVDRALTISMGFGGHTAAIIVTKENNNVRSI